MPLYACRAVDEHNTVSEARLEARTIEAAIERLLAEGKTALSITEVGHDRDSQTRRGKRTDLGPAHLAEFLSHTAVLLHAGMPVERAISHVAGSRANGQISALAKRLQGELKAGKTLSEAMRSDPASIMPYVLNAVAAGEAGAQLEKAIAQVAAHIEREARVRGEIRSALVYPAILVAVAGVAVTLLMLVLMPQFKPLFEGMEDRLPWGTRLLLAASDYFFLILLGAATVAAGLHVCFRSMRADGRRRIAIDRLKLRMPLSIGRLVLDTQTAIFARLLALQIDNGIPLQRALGLAGAAVPNRQIAEALDLAREDVRQGRRLSFGLARSGLLDAATLDLIRVGEEASDLVGVLRKTADLCERRVQQSTKRLMDILVPAITIGLGVLVAAIVACILMAMLSVNDLAVR